MGHRTIKRVSFDFDWPLWETWIGYVNPHYEQCPRCKGEGQVQECLVVWNTSTFLQTSFTHGGAFSPCRTLPPEWRKCSDCRGTGVFADKLDAYEAWEPYEPPAGDGYQLWETTGAGSPISPVFENLEEMATWCADYATTFGSIRQSREEWMQLFTDDEIGIDTLGLVPFPSPGEEHKKWCDWPKKQE